jgi:hypothetical protein
MADAEGAPVFDTAEAVGGFEGVLFGAAMNESVCQVCVWVLDCYVTARPTAFNVA